MSDLTILQVKYDDPDKEKYKNLPSLLPRPPFVGVINGGVRSGKSVLLMNMIYNKNFYKNIFDRIIFISPTVNNDKRTLKHLAEDDDIIKISDNLDNLDEIIKGIVELKNEDEEETNQDYLIILDDCLGYIQRKGYFSYLVSRYRHFRISMLITSQQFREIPLIIRNNATFYIIYGTHNAKEIKKYVEEFSGEFKNFENMYYESTHEKYNFLYLNMREGDAYHNFEGKLTD